ncbi:MAG: SAM-dependent methyltransferase, partial [Phormidesmis sp. CAN_BIN36]|nr:SAM-dependent methyltransferase [Phormidesmis sp. CAN_BIN36]
IVNALFDEWQLAPNRFNAILASNAWHWTPPEIRCQKAAAALNENGSLILLWNMSPQLPLEVHQALNEVYQSQAPSLVAEREDRATQERILQGLTQDVADSGLFRTPISEHLPCQVTYSIDNYLALLNTFSPYRMLDPIRRDSIFISLREVLEKLGEGVQVSYLSAFQVSQKI